MINDLKITDAEFNEIKEIMYDFTGVFLLPTKRNLVVSRLRKRMDELKMKGFREYIKRLQDKSTREMDVFINAITTNETFFFRGTSQFNYLYEDILPNMIDRKSKQGKKKITAWSAACSTGAEPYSLVMAFREFLKGDKSWQIKVYATDINSTVLEEAREGIYPERSLMKTPKSLATKYFENIKKGTRPGNFYKLKESVKKDVEFKQHNLKNAFPVKDLDFIFLRNVMIYFDVPMKKKVVSHLINNLHPEGYFFISLSESLIDVKAPLKTVGPAIYKLIKE